MPDAADGVGQLVALRPCTSFGLACPGCARCSRRCGWRSASSGRPAASPRRPRRPGSPRPAPSGRRPCPRRRPRPAAAAAAGRSCGSFSAVLERLRRGAEHAGQAGEQRGAVGLALDRLAVDGDDERCACCRPARARCDRGSGRASAGSARCGPGWPAVTSRGLRRRHDLEVPDAPEQGDEQRQAPRSRGRSGAVHGVQRPSATFCPLAAADGPRRPASRRPLRASRSSATSAQRMTASAGSASRPFTPATTRIIGTSRRPKARSQAEDTLASRA